MKKVITAGITAAIIAGFSMASHAAPVKDMSVDITGVGQIINTWQEGAGNDDGLDLRRMRLQIKADPAEKVGFYTAVDLTNRGTLGDSKIIDMYVDLKYVPQATLRVGQFRLPNSYELNTGVYDKDLINDTIGLGIYSMRDRGFMLSGSPIKELSWAITATNGAGANANTDDGDMFLAQLNYMPLENLSFKIWGSSENDSATVVDSDAIGLGFNYTVSGLHLYGEYNAKDIASVLDCDQYYVTAAYKIPESNFSLVGRYENLEIGAAETDVTSVGINWDFEKNARLQLSRDMFDGGNNDRTDLQLSVKF